MKPEAQPRLWHHVPIAKNKQQSNFVLYVQSCAKYEPILF